MSNDKFEVADDFLTIGRTFAEYRRMFDLTVADLALVANLLFVYDDRLDREFHAAALRELARVAREEARVFPLASLDRTRSAFVDPVTETLRADGHAVSFREVPYEFQPGATEMLVVEPA